MSTRILLADDHQVMREGLRALLDKQKEMEVVGEATDGRSAVSLAKKLKPDLVVMDVAMPDLNGIEATRQITRMKPAAKVLALSMHRDRRFVTEMLQAGASGYLLKNGAFKELTEAIRTVVSGETYLSPRVAGTVVTEYLEHVANEPAPASAFSSISNREREVLQLVAEGNSTKEIAARLGLSGKTVEVHRQHIMDKLGLHTVAELTKYAIREGLTSLDP